MLQRWTNLQLRVSHFPRDRCELDFVSFRRKSFIEKLNISIRILLELRGKLSGLRSITLSWMLWLKRCLHIELPDRHSEFTWFPQCFSNMAFVIGSFFLEFPWHYESITKKGNLHYPYTYCIPRMHY